MEQDKRREALAARLQSGRDAALAAAQNLLPDCGSWEALQEAGLDRLIREESLRKAAKEKALAEENAKKLEGVQVIIRAKSGSSGKLFGAVTSAEIAEALKEQYGIEIEKNKIVQSEPIKTYGSYTVKAKLGYEVSGTVNLLVVEG